MKMVSKLNFVSGLIGALGGILVSQGIDGFSVKLYEYYIFFLVAADTIGLYGLWFLRIRS